MCTTWDFPFLQLQESPSKGETKPNDDNEKSAEDGSSYDSNDEDIFMESNEYEPPNLPLHERLMGGTWRFWYRAKPGSTWYMASATLIQDEQFKPMIRWIKGSYVVNSTMHYLTIPDYKLKLASTFTEHDPNRPNTEVRPYTCRIY